MRDRIVEYVGKDPKRFTELVSVYLAGPFRVTQRAAWPLSYCVQRYPELIYPHLKQIIREMKKSGASNAVKRNTVRMLQFIMLPRASQGQVASLCFEFLNNPKEPIAVRVFSMTVLANLAKDIPELQRELRIMIEDQLSYGSAAFVTRGKSILKKMKTNAS